ncbi:MAG: tyrosine--tRNA ligase [Nanoarchaeota archaeon]|nr:tyrosine--tRNA ligase [Nanoarchaeota archaeon]
MVDDRLRLVRRNTVEIIEESELEPLFKEKKHPVAYCGYETSGEVHLGHLVTITKLMDLMEAGCKIKVLFADWHTWLNQKGEWDFIHDQVKEWKAIFKKAGLKDAEFVLGSSFQRDLAYIDDILKMSLKTTMKRALRSMQEVARDIEHAKVSQLIYPFMQIEDIKALKLDIAYAGIEQRKIHMLARELLPELGWKAPLCIHTPLIPSIAKEGKMSSSDPESLISVKDSPESIRKKLNKAFCPEGVIKDNPVLAITGLIVFPRIDSLEVKRPEKFGGNLAFGSFDELSRSYEKKELHPQDLKKAVAEELISILGPLR